MALFVLCKLILQTRMRSHPVGLDDWFLVGPFIFFHISCVNSEGSGETVQMRRLAWAFAGRLCDKYHNLMSWFKFDQDWPTGFREIQDWKCGRWMDDGPLVYYKLTLSAFGSGELKKMDIIKQIIKL